MTDSDYDDDVERYVSAFNEILQSNKTASDLISDVLEVIKSNTTAAFAEALATSLLDAAKQNPRRIDVLVLAIIGVIPDAKTIVVKDFIDGPSNFDDVFKFDLLEFMSNYLHETQLHIPKQTQITPNNSTLATALFSASALKHGLLSNVKSPYMFARQGLQLPNAHFERERAEAVAIGACLQLLVAGTTMMSQSLKMSDGLDAIISALKKLREDGIVSHPAGVKLLDWTIDISEDGFKEEKSAEEAWNMLFSA